MNNQAVIVKPPVFNLPYDGIFRFDINQPHKLTGLFQNKSFEINLEPGTALSNKPVPMVQKAGRTFINVTGVDGLVYRVRMKTADFTKISLIFVERLPPVRFNPQMTMLNLVDLGLTFNEYEQMLEYYNNNKTSLEREAKKKFIKRKDSGLPRTVVYVPDGQFKGMHALLKSHGPMTIGPEGGLGAYYRVTFVLPLDVKLPLHPSQMNVFRSGLDLLCDKESNVNTLLINATNIYSVGVNFRYRGKFRSRIGTDLESRVLNQPKDFIPQLTNQFKSGYLLNYLEGGTYREFLRKSPKLSYLETIVFNLKYAYALASLHNQYGTLHRDQKPENIFLTKHWDPRLGDFGFAAKIAEQITPAGTPLYNAPEILSCRNNMLQANPSSDVWGLGLILLASIGGNTFLERWEKSFEVTENHEENLNYMVANIERVKNEYIAYYRNGVPVAEPLILIIEKCLDMNPQKRLTAIDVFNRLSVIYYDLLNKQVKQAKNITNQSAISSATI